MSAKIEKVVVNIEERAHPLFKRPAPRPGARRLHLLVRVVSRPLEKVSDLLPRWVQDRTEWTWSNLGGHSSARTTRIRRRETESLKDFGGIFNANKQA